jgi:hypothetical protein
MSNPTNDRADFTLRCQIDEAVFTCKGENCFIVFISIIIVYDTTLVLKVLPNRSCNPTITITNYSLDAISGRTPAEPESILPFPDAPRMGDGWAAGSLLRRGVSLRLAETTHCGLSGPPWPRFLKQYT